MSDLLEKTFYAYNGRERLIIFNKSFGQFVSYYFDDELIAQNEIPIQLSFNALTQKKSFYELVVALNIWDLNPFSPVSNVPSIGAGETPNHTPAHNPPSNGVPVPTVCANCGKEFKRPIKTNLCYDCDFYYALNPQFRPKSFDGV